jgi:hypothetical protein
MILWLGAASVEHTLSFRRPIVTKWLTFEKPNIFRRACVRALAKSYPFVGFGGRVLFLK